MQDGPVKGQPDTPRWGGFDKFQKYKTAKSKSCDYADLDYIDDNTSTKHLEINPANRSTDVTTTRQIVSVRVTGRREVRTTVTTRVIKTKDTRRYGFDELEEQNCDNSLRKQDQSGRPKVNTDLKISDSFMQKLDFKSSASPTMVVNAGWFSSLKRTKKNKNKCATDGDKATSRSAWDLSSMQRMVQGFSYNLSLFRFLCT